MNGQDYTRLAHEAFEPFLSELGFSMESPAISGRQYRVSFVSETHAIWIAYEPGDNALFVHVFGCRNGVLSDIDDTNATPRLGDLNKRYMSTVPGDKYAENYEYFKGVLASDEEEQAVLKVARELRLVLPSYLADSKG